MLLTIKQYSDLRITKVNILDTSDNLNMLDKSDALNILDKSDDLNI